jgi:D-amino-acid dehydrogenase
VASLTALEHRWLVNTQTGPFDGDRVVIALGPWSRVFLERMGLRVPMAYERGYHMHYGGAETGGTLALTRPVYDPAGGYVLSPMEQGLRLTTGVELNDCDAPPNHAQLDAAEISAREAINLGERLDDTAWMGRRPTLPDSRPAIGAAPGRPGLFVAFGHQHIGFNTGPGTARVLADLMDGTPPEIPAAPFSPSRFIR